MDLDTHRIRELLTRREEIDQELAAIFTGTAPKKTITCGKCKAEGHTARSCPQKEYDHE